MFYYKYLIFEITALSFACFDMHLKFYHDCFCEMEICAWIYIHNIYRIKNMRVKCKLCTEEERISQVHIFHCILLFGARQRLKACLTLNVCIYIQFLHTIQSRWKAKRTPDPRWAQTLRPTRKFTLQSSYSKWHLIHLLAIYLDQRSHLLTLTRRRRCQMAPGGKHVPKDTFLFTVHTYNHTFNQQTLCPVGTSIIKQPTNNIVFSMDGNQGCQVCATKLTQK